MKIIDGRYPVIGTEPKQYIPYEVLLSHEERAIQNHGQTLERLAERGGLSWFEILCVLEEKNILDNEIKRMSDKERKKKVWKHILKFYNYQYQ